MHILLIFLCLTGFAQRKHLIIDREIIKSGLPEKFTRPNGQTIYGGYKALTDLHFIDGWRDEVRPEINPALQYYGPRYYNAAMDAVTWPIIDKTIEELAEEKENLLQSIEQDFDILAIKQLLIILTKDILNAPEITAETINAIATIYPQYRADKSYLLNDVFVYETELYRVVQAHTSQSDWNPNTTPALYTKYTPPVQVAEWVQPTGAQDAYNIGDKVLFEGKTYTSLIDANTWSPATYPAGWQEI
ncbi:MAG: hypothetical protein OEY01_11175 [Desulfobulbaceae bacterium]|nr:hypothetical protein [Desulfobulbaceae bacterium]